MVLAPPPSVAAGIQASNIKGNAQRANAVKQSFLKSYNAYKQYCFGQDQLNPIAKNCQNPLGGWGASLIDAQDTAYIMGFKGIYNAQWGYLMAASAAVVAPIIALYFFAQRYFVEGIVATGVKG